MGDYKELEESPRGVSINARADQETGIPAYVDQSELQTGEAGLTT